MEVNAVKLPSEEITDGCWRRGGSRRAPIPAAATGPKRPNPQLRRGRSSMSSILAERHAPASQPISGHKGRDRFICAILTRDVLPLLEVRVAVRLGIFFNCKTGQCDPGYDTLANELGIARRTLFRAIARLKTDGWIEVHRVGRDGNVQFSLFVPPQLRPSTAALPAAGANTLSPQEVPTQCHLSEPPEPPHEVTENGVRGDRNRGVEVPHRLAAQITCEPENLNSAAFHAARTSGADRDSASTSTVDDAPVPEPDGPVPRADAQTEPVATQKPPSHASKIDLGRPTDDVRAAFADVSYAWPSDRTDDKGYTAYVGALAAAQGDTEVVLDAIWERLEESGADPPWLSDALRRIERDLRMRQ
jgi:hypothetical protein